MMGFPGTPTVPAFQDSAKNSCIGDQGGGQPRDWALMKSQDPSRLSQKKEQAENHKQAGKLASMSIHESWACSQNCHF